MTLQPGELKIKNTKIKQQKRVLFEIKTRKSGELN